MKRNVYSHLRELFVVFLGFFLGGGVPPFCDYGPRALGMLCGHTADCSKTPSWDIYSLISLLFTPPPSIRCGQPTLPWSIWRMRQHETTKLHIKSNVITWTLLIIIAVLLSVRERQRQQLLRASLKCTQEPALPQLQMKIFSFGVCNRKTKITIIFSSWHFWEFLRTWANLSEQQCRLLNLEQICILSFRCSKVYFVINISGEEATACSFNIVQIVARFKH